MRKRRTREHVISDLGYNYVERQVLLAGHVLQELVDDYGYDGLIQTFSTNGEVESEEIYIQLKCTDHIEFSDVGNGFVFDLSVRDLKRWLYSKLPVALILYDARLEKAYFIELQEYFKVHKSALKNVRKFVRVYLPAGNLWNTQSVNYINSLKNARD